MDTKHNLRKTERKKPSKCILNVYEKTGWKIREIEDKINGHKNDIISVVFSKHLKPMDII